MAGQSQGYIIIDIGTGNVRVAITNIQAEVLHVERDDICYEKDDRYPDALYFNPDKLWAQIITLTRNALHQVPDITVKAITASSQREGIVLLGPGGESLLGFPNIDHRGRQWEDIMEDKSRIYQLTGRYPSSLFSAMKLVGLRKVYPDIYGKATVMLSISDWVEYRLTGVAGYEHSQASETLLYDVEAMSWSDELCSVFNIDKKMLPDLYASGTIAGKILPNCASDLDISPEAVIVVGGADTQLAVRSTQPSVDDVVIVAGTTTPIVKITNHYVTDEKERSWTNRHIEADQFILETNAGVTGLNYQRLKTIFYPNEPYRLIEEELASISKPDCFASLGSLIADEKNPLINGGFVFSVPVSQQLSRACFVQATLWDIACCIKANYDTLCDVHPHTSDYLWACGGGMQSRTLQQYVANLTKKKIRVRKGYEQASAVGGALACNEALGIKEQVEASVDIIRPQQEDFDDLYKKWKKVREEFKQRHLEKEIV